MGYIQTCGASHRDPGGLEEAYLPRRLLRVCFLLLVPSSFGVSEGATVTSPPADVESELPMVGKLRVAPLLDP